MKTVFFNGIWGDTGAYAFPPKTPKALADTLNALSPLKRAVRAQTKYGPFIAEFVKLPNPKGQLDDQAYLTTDLRLRDLDDLAQVGWGILYPKQQEQQLLEPLAPLLALRRQQAGSRYREIAYEPGPQRLETLDQLVASKLGVYPEHCPYYLLIIGQPKDIPFQLQYRLDRQLAVGRLALDTPAEYGHYARNVVRHEMRQTPRLKACFFGTQHENDSSTALSSQFLVKDLARRTANSFDPARYQISTRLGEEASKLALSKLMGGPLTPDLLLSATHGVILRPHEREREFRQGAAICADWPGPQAWGGKPVPERFIFAGKDIAPNADFNGMISLLYSCYSGGTPQYSSFPLEPHLSPGHESAQPFMAHLPKRMLAVERGARAVIAHIDTTFIWSFLNEKKQEQTEVFQAFIRELLEGRTVGYAMNVFQRAFLERLAEYQELVETQNQRQLRWSDDRLVQAWFAVNDLRNYILLGDPAVRLPTLSR